MAVIKTVVTLDRKEIDSAVEEVARKQLDKCVGGVSIEYQISEARPVAVRVLDGATVTFTGKVHT